MSIPGCESPVYAKVRYVTPAVALSCDWWVIEIPVIVFKALDVVEGHTVRYDAVRSPIEPIHAIDGPMNEPRARALALGLQNTLEVLGS